MIMLTMGDLAGKISPAVKNMPDSVSRYDPKTRRLRKSNKKYVFQFGVATIAAGGYAFAVATSDGPQPGFMDVVAGATAQRVWRMSYTVAGYVYDLF